MRIDELFVPHSHCSVSLPFESNSRQASAECARSATVTQQSTLVNRLSSQVRIKLLATEIPPAFREIRVGARTPKYWPSSSCRFAVLTYLISMCPGTASTEHGIAFLRVHGEFEVCFSL
jgi:hypothetical protein